MAMIEIENLSFSYNGANIIKQACFAVEQGDFLSISGSNGAGKSTLLKLMLGILQPDSGRISIDGKDSKTTAQEGKISYVSQRATAFNTDFPATVSEVVMLGLYRKRIFKRFGQTEKDKVNDALAMVGMEAFKDAQIGKLSGGQQQRVFIARALVRAPKIIFLDEPTVGIDTDSVGSICCLLGELNKTHGITVLMVTHDISSILSHANKILHFKITGEIELFRTEEYTKMFVHDHPHRAHEPHKQVGRATI